jgi:hypothetical protein
MRLTSWAQDALLADLRRYHLGVPIVEWKMYASFFLLFCSCLALGTPWISYGNWEACSEPTLKGELLVREAVKTGLWNQCVETTITCSLPPSSCPYTSIKYSYQECFGVRKAQLENYVYELSNTANGSNGSRVYYLVEVLACLTVFFAVCVTVLSVRLVRHAVHRTTHEHEDLELLHFSEIKKQWLQYLVCSMFTSLLAMSLWVEEYRNLLVLYRQGVASTLSYSSPTSPFSFSPPSPFSIFSSFTCAEDVSSGLVTTDTAVFARWAQGWLAELLVFLFGSMGLLFFMFEMRREAFRDEEAVDV